MKVYFRRILIILIAYLPCLFSANAYAVDHIICSIISNGIPSQSQNGVSYNNIYQCNNTYPSSFPAIQLGGSVLGNAAGTSLSGTCLTQPISPGGNCQFTLGYTPQQPGTYTFYVQVSVGSMYFINLPSVTTTPGHFITWPGRTSGDATVDASGNGDGSFFANATDSSGHAVFYTFHLSGAGTVTAGTTLGSFVLTGATTPNETVTVTANADDAPSVPGNPILILVNSLPVKKLLIYNNSTAAIYPVIEAPILDKDAWLQAHFAETNIAINKYAQTHVNRVYINPTTGGIAPGASVKITIPFYSQLVPNPNPALADQYIDWWNAMRVYLYDNLTALTAVYNADSASPVSPLTAGPTCDAGSVCGPLTIFSNSVGLPLNDPYQLTEYTFANVITGHGVPYPIDDNYVDYDISYVDHVYLPVAMEPYGNDMVGYTGTVMNLTNFRSILNSFITDESWPTYTATPQYPNKRLPGTYNITIDNQPLTANTIFNNIKTNWADCTSNPSNPYFSDCSNVKDLFDNNAFHYQTACVQGPPSIDEYLQHVYGWVAFTCANVTNDLASTPGADYKLAESAYKKLQYNYEGTPAPTPFEFNPYVKLIHSPSYIGMNAYAFSIDDAVGNMNELGNGVVTAVAGVTGLPNPNAFDLNKVATVGLGAPTNSTTWVAYGICTTTPNKQLPQGSLSFQLLSVAYPCPISLRDSNNVLYHFTVLASPPYTGGNKNDYIQCAVGDNWCSQINVNFATQHDIATSSPL